MKQIIEIDADTIEEVETVTKEERTRHNRKELKARKEELQIRRDLDKAEIDQINIDLAKFK